MRADLAIKTTADGLGATLRADRIRRDTLVQLARALRDDPDNHVRNALDALIDAADRVSPYDAEGAEVDYLVDDIESVAGMGPAVVDLTRGDLQQLARESAEAWTALAPVLRGAA